MFLADGESLCSLTAGMQLGSIWIKGVGAVLRDAVGGRNGIDIQAQTESGHIASGGPA